MPYIFTPAAPDSPVTRHESTSAFRAAYSALDLKIVGSKVTLAGTPFGKLSYTKKSPRPADVERAPMMVQPSNDGPSLDDVLASIDDLETDAELDAARRAGVADSDDDEDTHEPVTFAATPAEDIDAIVDWQLNGRDNPARRAQVGTPSRSPRVGVRRSHANCTHATSGEAGKKARAACRKERAAAARTAAA